MAGGAFLHYQNIHSSFGKGTCQGMVELNLISERQRTGFCVHCTGGRQVCTFQIYYNAHHSQPAWELLFFRVPTLTPLARVMLGKIYTHSIFASLLIVFPVPLLLFIGKVKELRRAFKSSPFMTSEPYDLCPKCYSLNWRFY